MTANHWYLRAVLVIGLLVHGPVFSAGTAQESLAAAQALYDQGNYPAAVIELKNALLLEPDNAAAHLLLGKTYLESGDPASAESELTRARDLGMGADGWMLPLGEAYLRQGKNQALLTELVPGEEFPAELRAGIFELRGKAYLASRQFGEADEAFSAALALQPGNAEALLGKAKIAFHQKDLQDASGYIEQLLALQPDHAEAWMMKGGLLSASGDQAGAIAAFQRAIDSASGMLAARARIAKATAHIALGEYDAASREVEAIRQLRPGIFLADYLDAQIHFQKNELNKALTSVHRALGAAPAHLPSQWLAGSIYYRKGQYEQALSYLREYWNSNTGNARAAMLLAAALDKTGKKDAAIEVLEKTVQSRPDDARLLAILGSLYISAGENTKGLESLERASELAPDSAEILTRLARGRLASGETGQATTDLEGAVELGEDVVEADILLVMVYLRQGNADAARDAASSLVDREPDSALASNLLGSAHFIAGDYQAARAAYSRALQLDDSFVPAMTNLAALDDAEGDRTSAKQRYHDVLAHDAGNEKALVALSKFAVGEGREAEAVELLKKAVEHNPGSIKPALLLSELYRQQRDTARALELARDVSKDHPRNPGVLKVLLRAQAATGDLDGAIATLQNLIQVTPPSAQLHYQLAQLYLKQKDARAAREHLEQAIRLQPDNPSAQMMLGRLEIVAKDYVAAEAIASNLQQAHPQAADGYQLEGDVLVARGQIKEALPAYEKAYSLEPNSRLVVALFNARRLTGDADGAVALAREWLEGHPRDVGMRLSLASHLQQQGRVSDAIDEYLAVLEQDPGNIGVLKNVALLYHEQGSDKGIGYAKQAYELAPGRPDILDTYGWLLVKGGDPQRGLVLLQEAVVSAPHLPQLRYHMAVGLAEAGRIEEARRELKRLLDKEADFPGAAGARELLDQLEQRG